MWQQQQQQQRGWQQHRRPRQQRAWPQQAAEETDPVVVGVSAIAASQAKQRLELALELELAHAAAAGEVQDNELVRLLEGVKYSSELAEAYLWAKRRGEALRSKAAIAARDALVLSLTSQEGHKSRESFLEALRTTLGQEFTQALAAELLHTYSRLFDGVPGRFASLTQELHRKRPRKKQERQWQDAPEEQASWSASDEESMPKGPQRIPPNLLCGRDKQVQLEALVKDIQNTPSGPLPGDFHDLIRGLWDRVYELDLETVADEAGRQFTNTIAAVMCAVPQQECKDTQVDYWATNVAVGLLRRRNDVGGLQCVSGEAAVSKMPRALQKELWRFTERVLYTSALYEEQLLHELAIGLMARTQSIHHVIMRLQDDPEDFKQAVSELQSVIEHHMNEYEREAASHDLLEKLKAQFAEMEPWLRQKFLDQMTLNKEYPGQQVRHQFGWAWILGFAC